MACCAVYGSYTPGAKTYGWVLRSVRKRRLGLLQRDTGTVKPRGSSGVGCNSSWTWWLLDMPGLIVIAVVNRAAVNVLAFALWFDGRKWILGRIRGKYRMMVHQRLPGPRWHAQWHKVHRTLPIREIKSIYGALFDERLRRPPLCQLLTVLGTRR